MLASLTVQNFAIIDNINIDFHNGLTVLTGETGAGKSLIIDAIGLLFGNRASSNMIRTGAAKAIVEGVFTDCGKKVMEIIAENGLDSLDDNMVVFSLFLSFLYHSTPLYQVNNSLPCFNPMFTFHYIFFVSNSRYIGTGAYKYPVYSKG